MRYPQHGNQTDGLLNCQLWAFRQCSCLNHGLPMYCKGGFRMIYTSAYGTRLVQHIPVCPRAFADLRRVRRALCWKPHREQRVFRVAKGRRSKAVYSLEVRWQRGRKCDMITRANEAMNGYAHSGVELEGRVGWARHGASLCSVGGSARELAV